MPAKPTGRPSKRTDAIVQEVITRLSKGEPLAVICRDDHIPHDSTVRDWANSDAALSLAIADARVTGFDTIAHRARMTLRGKTEDLGGESTGDVQRDKAIAEFDLKLLAKWDPKRYGDKIAHIGGDDSDPALKHEVLVKFVGTE